MLILACVCLLIALKGAKDLPEVFLLAETPTYPSDVGAGGLFAVLLGGSPGSSFLFGLIAVGLIAVWILV